MAYDVPLNAKLTAGVLSHGTSHGGDNFNQLMVGTQGVKADAQV